MSTDSRTDDQIRDAVKAAAALARQISDDPMSTPQHRHLAETLHQGIDHDLTTLDQRGQS
ncbi:hypothetical protein ACIQM4_34430 [Streptomyces sp. NPDC091272]|uniref:hypothetical protein n=1 Tax=Streptomyces sp. NPDC091272 TaxID=3365981 RepID=UPI0038189618